MPITVKEVLSTAARLVGREDLGSEADRGSSSEELLLFLRCFNLVENEIALDYFPLTTEETAVVLERKLTFNALACAPLRILKVVADGEELAFETYADHLYLPSYEAGFVRIVYVYAPKEKKLTDSSDFSGRVSPRLLAFGTAAEFLLAVGRSAEAAMFDRKYRDALRAAGMPREKLTVRARRWA